VRRMKTRAALARPAARTAGATRETDVTGWYKTDAVGGQFTEIVLDNKSVLSTILSRIGAVVRNGLDTDQFSRVTFTFHVFPMIGMRRILAGRATRPSNPDLEKRQTSNRLNLATKRLIDVLEACCAGAAFSGFADHRGRRQANFARAGSVSAEADRGAWHPLTFLNFVSMFMNTMPASTRNMSGS